jgi:hypothetical protein
MQLPYLVRQITHCPNYPAALRNPVVNSPTLAVRFLAISPLSMRSLLLAGCLALGLAPSVLRAQTTNSGTDKFAQLETLLPTPNSYRTASGAPGTDYWQQRADYNIKVTLDDQKQAITGSETITYTNLSPDVLTYLWVQLDQNILAKNSITAATQVGQITAGRLGFQDVDNQLAYPPAAAPSRVIRREVELQHQRPAENKRAQRLRVFPGGQELPLRNGAILPPHGRVFGRDGLAE